MGYERYPRGTNPQGGYYNRDETQDYGRDYGSGREGSYSSARDYQSAGRFRDDDRDTRSDYGQRDGGYGRRDYRGRDAENYGRGDYDRDSRERMQRREQFGAMNQGGRGMSDRERDFDRDRSMYARNDDRDRNRDFDRNHSYGRQPQGYDYEDRGFFARAGDEVRSWFGDDDAETRREADMRFDDRYYDRQYRNDGGHRDADYRSWRDQQMSQLDRDYAEYRQENRSKFHNEFANWRTERQGQRDLVSKVGEHMDVVGSDGKHVGTVDKVRGDRILLTKNDKDADGHHHSFPSRWLQSVDDKVKLNRSAEDAKGHWREEERSQAMFGYGDNAGRTMRGDREDYAREAREREAGARDSQGRVVNRTANG